MARRKRSDHDHKRNDHDADDRGKGRHKRKPKPKPKPHHKPKPPAPPTTTTEKLKESSKQSGTDAMTATPGLYPADPANAQAVFTTGPGQAVEYNYVRIDGTGAEQYALAQSQQSAPVPPIAGAGQTVTSGAANNPT
jgi:hypothetical protein